MSRRKYKRWAKLDPVVAQTRKEAAGAGASLHFDGEGGVDAGKALHVFRRDKWACRLCGTSDDLELDHLDGHDHLTPEFAKLEHDSIENLITICHECQDDVHAADRKIRDMIAEQEDDAVDVDDEDIDTDPDLEAPDLDDEEEDEEAA